MQEKNEHKEHEMHAQKESYKPLFIIIGMILLPAIVLAFKQYSAGDIIWIDVGANIMAGYFIVFAGFKFLDIKGFKDGFASYDLLAMQTSSYGYLYPFIELTLGLIYLTRFRLDLFNWVTLFLMLFGALGVLISLKKTKGIKCACLGTVINLPLSNITLIEDFSMAAMAALMLFS
jgi:cation transport ATPase